MARSRSTHSEIAQRGITRVKSRLLRAAELEIDDAVAWYEAKQLGLGHEFLDCFEQAMQAVENRPDAFPRMETFHSVRNVRRCPLPRFPFNVVYEIGGSELLVLAVAHVRRRPNYWRRRK